MNIRILSTEQITAYDTYLRIEERAAGTREKYLRDVQAFVCWLNGAAAGRAPGAFHSKRGLVRPQRPVPFSWLGGLPDAVCQGAAAAVSGPGP